MAPARPIREGEALAVPAVLAALAAQAAMAAAQARVEPVDRPAVEWSVGP